MKLSRALSLGSSAAAMAALTLSATAADLRVPPTVYKAAVVSPAFTWSGIYFGVNGGGAFSDPRFQFLGRSDTGDFHRAGALIGLTAGAMYQSGPYVVGLEGEADWANTRGGMACLPGSSCKADNSGLFTAAGLVGFTLGGFNQSTVLGERLRSGQFQVSGTPRLNDTLIYAKVGGVARKFSISADGNSTANEMLVGTMVAGGIRIPISDSTAIGAEFAHHDFRNFNCQFECGAVTPLTVSYRENVVKGVVTTKW
jgi:hypothetical protein